MTRAVASFAHQHNPAVCFCWQYQVLGTKSKWPAASARELVTRAWNWQYGGLHIIHPQVLMGMERDTREEQDSFHNNLTHISALLESPYYVEKQREAQNESIFNYMAWLERAFQVVRGDLRTK